MQQPLKSRLPRGRDDCQRLRSQHRRAEAEEAAPGHLLLLLAAARPGRRGEYLIFRYLSRAIVSS